MNFSYYTRTPHIMWIWIQNFVYIELLFLRLLRNSLYFWKSYTASINSTSSSRNMMIYFFLILNAINFLIVNLFGHRHLTLQIQSFILNQIYTVFLKLVRFLQKRAALWSIYIFPILITWKRRIHQSILPWYLFAK